MNSHVWVASIKPIKHALRFRAYLTRNHLSISSQGSRTSSLRNPNLRISGFETLKPPNWPLKTFLILDPGNFKFPVPIHGHTHTHTHTHTHKHTPTHARGCVATGTKTLRLARNISFLRRVLGAAPNPLTLLGKSQRCLSTQRTR
jgi:hypothetical protein